MRNSNTALLLLVLTGSLASAAPVAGPITNPANGHDYYLLEASTWTAAEAEAVSLGGHLVTINDDAEDDWLYTTELGAAAHRWIGFTDAAQEGTWVWVSGEPVTYTNWLPGEPSGGAEDYAEWDHNGWNDVLNDGSGVPHQGIVEVVPVDGPTITVCWDGSGDYTTIQDGIDVASNGDEVVVCEGTYTGDGNRDLDFDGKAITVRSIAPTNWATVEATVIDCQGSWSEYHRGFYFHSAEGRDSVVSGLTIKNGRAMTGAGIYITNAAGPDGYAINGSKPTIEHCLIMNNKCDAGGDGGGIKCEYRSPPVIRNCVFKGNTANRTPAGGGAGGGIYVDRMRGYGHDNADDVVVLNCLFFGNSALYAGGGVHCGVDAATTIINCTFAKNTVTWGDPRADGAGVSNGCWGVYIRNCVFWGHTPSNDVVRQGSIPITVSYSNIEGGHPGTGNINNDPLFVDGDNANCRLQAGSSCIDAGDNSPSSHLSWGNLPEGVTSDLDGNPRFVDDPCTADTGDGVPPIVDMGAYEFSSDCNTNGIPDTCDLDCGTNGGPCDVPGCGQSSDCNTNGIPDECDISDGTCDDCNTNGIPDGCEADFDGDGLIDDCDPDIDNDDVPNENDACDYTPLGANIVTDPEDYLYGTLRGDLDGDCDCDLEDYAVMQQDFTGPSNP